MAKVNRYTQLTGSKFNPLSMQELSLVPMHMRKQEDALAKTANELGVIDSKSLGVDSDIAARNVEDYENQILDYTNNLESEGFTNLNKSRLQQLAAQRKEMLGNKGIVGRANAAYAQHQANISQLEAVRKAGKISQKEVIAGAQHSLNQYANNGGARTGSTYSNYNAVDRLDINKMATSIADKMQSNPKKLETMGFEVRNTPEGKKYFDVKRGGSYTEKGAIARAVKDQLMINPDVMNDLKQRYQLGLINDPNKYLDTLAGVLERDYAVNNRNARVSSKAYVPYEKAKESLYNNYNNGDMSFEGYVTESCELHNDKTLDYLEGIIDGKSDVEWGSIIPNVFKAGMGQRHLKSARSKKTFTKLNEAAQNRFIDVKNAMELSGELPKNSDITDNNVLKQVLKYARNHKAVTVQPKLITFNNHLDNKKMGNKIATHSKSRGFYIPGENKSFTLQEMINKQLLTGNPIMDTKLIAYKGQLTADNNYSQMVPSEDRDGYIAPHVINIGGLDVLVTPSMDEMNSPQGVANKRFNIIFNKLTNVPDKPHEFTWHGSDIKGGEPVKITRLSKNSPEYQKYKTPYMIQQVGEEPTGLTAGGFRGLSTQLSYK